MKVFAGGKKGESGGGMPVPINGCTKRDNGLDWLSGNRLPAPFIGPRGS